MIVRIFIFLYFICVSLCVQNDQTRVKIIPKVDIVIFGFATDVYNFFDKLLSKENETTPEPVDYDRIIGEIAYQIRMSASSILHITEIEAHLVDVRRAVRAILQLLEDMQRIVKATDPQRRKAYETRFLQNFEREKNNVYAVRTLLTLTVPDISSNLLSLIVKEMNCGMTGLEDFQTYYVNNLVVKAMALDLVYERFQDDLLHTDKLNSWISVVNSLLEEFETEKKRCKNRFIELAKTDFDSISDAKLLFDNNQKRFSYLRNDVLSLGGRYCSKYLKSYDKIFRKKDGNGNMIVALFGDEDNAVHFSRDQFERMSKTSFSRCTTEAETVSMINLFNVLEYDVVFLLMFPEDQKDRFQILLDQNTTSSIRVTIQEEKKYKTIVYVRKQNSTILQSDDYEVETDDGATSNADLAFDKMCFFNILSFALFVRSLNGISFF